MVLEHFDTVMSFAVVMLLMSLLITVLVQCVIALSGLRGWNLHFGMVQLIEQLNPGLKDHTAKIAKAVLEHPSVAHMPVWGGRRKATAIRPHELLRILADLSKDDSKELRGTAKQALTTAVKEIGGDELAALAGRAGAVASELTKLFPAQALAVQDAVNRGIASTSRLEVRVNEWFTTIMDRTTERFILYTRWITAAMAVVVVVCLQVDSVQLFKQLSSSAEIREKLIQGADATLKQAGAVLADTQKPRALASDAIYSMKDDLPDNTDKDLVSKAPDNLVTRKEGRDWLVGAFAEAKLPVVFAAYDKRFEGVTLKTLKELGASFDQAKSTLDVQGLQLVFHGAAGIGTDEKRQHLAGQIITVIFLSLGAPFWFNALRQLANLRPIIAGKVEKESASVI